MPGARRGLDLLGAAEQRAAARFEAEAVERGLAQRGLDPLAEVGGDGEIAGLEGAGERALELALGVGGVERGAADADPRAAARRRARTSGATWPSGPSASRIRLVARRRCDA